MAVVTSSTQGRSRPAVARVMAWMAEKRTAVNNDPRIVPGILGVAEPITVPTCCSAMTELSESCVAELPRVTLCR